MAIEIEHKFLLLNDDWRALVARSIKYKQGYLSSEANTSIRIRISEDKAWLNIKSATIGNSRHEYEYEIPFQDAMEIIENLCKKPLIEKTRHLVPIGSQTWEIDEFEGENLGLIVAEIELEGSDETFTKPSWIGEEVTYDLRYYNNNLSKIPFCKW